MNFARIHEKFRYVKTAHHFLKDSAEFRENFIKIDANFTESYEKNIDFCFEIIFEKKSNKTFEFFAEQKSNFVFRVSFWKIVWNNFRKKQKRYEKQFGFPVFVIFCTLTLK